MTVRFHCSALLIALAVSIFPANADIASDFTASPNSTHPLAWWWLNATIDNTTVDQQLTAVQGTSLYGGVVPCFRADNSMENAAFIPKYVHLIDKCKQLTMSVCINDDFDYPSGSAGTQMSKNPAYCFRQISKTDADATGPTTYTITIPAGNLLGCVAQSNSDKSVLNDITANVSAGKLTWTVPAGSWHIMVFYTTQSSTTLVNYIDSAAVKKWISLAYQPVYDAMPSYFGTTIKSEFFDDVAMCQSGSGWSSTSPTAWTDEYNTKFQAKYGYSPVKYYPALWYDVGANTAAVRSLLFGFRNDLFCRAFGKQTAEWCAAHNVEISGHYGNQGAVDWIRTAGDPIKFFKYTQRVGVEGWRTATGRAMNLCYRLGSAACRLYDKKYCVIQHYALIFNFTSQDLYGLAMEAFADGVNYMYPDGIAYDYPNMPYPPELSWRDPNYGPLMPDYNKWAGRCHLLLQGGRHVADIALLFPIAAYTADNYFGYNTQAYDYQAVGDALAAQSRRDFTYMHPEVLDSNCTIDSINHTINLNNKINWEKYKVFIIPGACVNGVINVSTIQKARDFYNSGGVVICTSKLPSRSAEIGMDSVVVNCATALFANPGTAYKKNTNAAGGKAYFIPNIAENVGGTDRLTWVLNDAVPVWDVKFDAQVNVTGGNLFYIHKVMGDTSYYFFGNSSNTAVNTTVRLKGKLTPKTMDPHTGVIANAQFQNTTDNGEDVTLVTLNVGAVKSMFISSVNPATGVGPAFNPKAADKGYSLHVQRRGSLVQIGFAVPPDAVDAHSEVLLQIFDLQGRIVRTLTDGKPVSAGYHTVNLDAKVLSEGQYLCRMKVAGFEKSAIVTLVK